MLVLSFKPGESLTLQRPDGTEEVIHFRRCSKSGRMSVALDIDPETTALRSSLQQLVQALETSTT